MWRELKILKLRQVKTRLITYPELFEILVGNGTNSQGQILKGLAGDKAKLAGEQSLANFASCEITSFPTKISNNSG